MSYQFEKVFVSKEALKYPITQNILENISQEKILYKEIPPEGKNTIFLTVKKGDMLKRIPYEDKTSACLIYQTNCRLGCTYCYLQSYYNSYKGITIYVNSQELLSQIDSTKRFKKFYAGELNDSLDLDNLTNYTKILIPFFNKRKDIFLELRTKTDNISNLLNLKPTSNIVITWSLNPASIIKEYESRTSSLQQRLKAGKSCQEAGYKIGFHLDPIIYTPNFEEEYGQLIELIAKNITKLEKIAYISLGGFRFTRDLAKIIREKPLQERRILSSEFVKCEDGKFRYFKPIRLKMYRYILDKIRLTLGDIRTYFCMEQFSRVIVMSLLHFAFCSKPC
ncbi:MAG: spore photoproduct lyase family protein [bacterium]